MEIGSEQKGDLWFSFLSSLFGDHFIDVYEPLNLLWSYLCKDVLPLPLPMQRRMSQSAAYFWGPITGRYYSMWIRIISTSY